MWTIILGEAGNEENMHSCRLYLLIRPSSFILSDVSNHRAQGSVASGDSGFHPDIGAFSLFFLRADLIGVL